MSDLQKEIEFYKEVTKDLSKTVAEFHNIGIGKDGNMIGDAGEMVMFGKSLMEIAAGINAMAINIAIEVEATSERSGLSKFMLVEIQTRLDRAVKMTGIVTSQRVQTNANSH